jgi:3-oxoacyl-[acyl-carrier-protein] synthase II
VFGSTYNLDDVDPACPGAHIRGAPMEVRIEHALSNSFGFGGQNVSLVLSGASTEKKKRHG